MGKQYQDQVDEREALRTDNAKALDALGRQGVNIDQMVFLALRLDAIVEMAFGDLDEPERVRYDLHYQRKLAQSIELWRSQAARARLTAPPNGRPMPPRG